MKRNDMRDEMKEGKGKKEKKRKERDKILCDMI